MFLYEKEHNVVKDRCEGWMKDFENYFADEM